MLTTGLMLFPWCQLLPPINYRNTFHPYYSSFHYILQCPAQQVRNTWNGGEHIMKRRARIIWQAGSKVKALLLIRNILFCFHGDGHRGRQWSWAESTSHPKNVCFACLLAQSQGWVCHTLESWGRFWSLLHQAATSLSMIISICIHVVANEIILSFCRAKL